MIKLKEAFTLQMGKTPARAKQSYWNDGSNQWVSISDLSNFDKYVGKTKETITDLAVKDSGIKKVPANTVIMSFKLSLGKTAITKDPVYTNEAIMAFIPNGKYEIDTNYLYHMFSGRDWSMGTNRAVMGATLNKATLGEIEISIPPISEQTAIANILDKVCDQIRLRQAQLKELDELVKSRFVELMDSAELSDELTVEQITERVKVGFVGTCEKYYTDETGVPMLRTGNITDHGVDMRDLKYVTADFHEKNRKSQIRRGDLLIARHGSNGQANVYDGPEAQCLNAVVIVPNQTAAKSVFLAGLINSPVVKEQIDRTLVGSTQHVVNTKSIANLVVRIPCLEVQEQYEAIVEQTDKSKLAVQQSIGELEELKKSLMQKYFG